MAISLQIVNVVVMEEKASKILQANIFSSVKGLLYRSDERTFHNKIRSTRIAVITVVSVVKYCFS